MPPAPYVVVKPEAGAREGTRQFRIAVHHLQGHYSELSDYVFKELPTMLLSDVNKGGKVFITDETGTYRLLCGGWTDVDIDDSDNTIFMERFFVQPFRSGGSKWEPVPGAAG